MKIRDEFKKFKHWAVSAVLTLDGALHTAWQNSAAFQQYLPPRWLTIASGAMIATGLIIHYARKGDDSATS